MEKTDYEIPECLCRVGKFVSGCPYATERERFEWDVYLQVTKGIPRPLLAIPKERKVPMKYGKWG